MKFSEAVGWCIGSRNAPKAAIPTPAPVTATNQRKHRCAQKLKMSFWAHRHLFFSYLPSLTRRFTASQKAEASISLRAGRRSRSPATPVNTNVQVLMVAGLPPLVSVTRTRSSSSPALRISAKGIRIVRSVYPAPVSASISVMETSRAQTSNASRVKNRCERTKRRR